MAVSTALVVMVIAPIVLVYLGPSDDTSLIGIRSAGLAATSARSHSDADRARLTAEVRAAGDDAASKINFAESGCDAQISQLAAVSTIFRAETQTAIQEAKDRVHLVAIPFLRDLQDEVDTFAHLTVVSPYTEQLFLSAIARIRVTAVGDGTRPGEVSTICQSALAEVRTKVKPVVDRP
jgi:hypothetical protein